MAGIDSIYRSLEDEDEDVRLSTLSQLPGSLRKLSEDDRQSVLAVVRRLMADPSEDDAVTREGIFVMEAVGEFDFLIGLMGERENGSVVCSEVAEVLGNQRVADAAPALI